MLDAATELVRRDGERVPMAQIAERAGVGVARRQMELVIHGLGPAAPPAA